MPTDSEYALAGEPSPGMPELADVIMAVRRQLSAAQDDGSLRFGLGPIELDLETTLSYTGDGAAGVRLYVLTPERQRSPLATHRVKVVLEPVEQPTVVVGGPASAADSSGPTAEAEGWGTGAEDADAPAPEYSGGGGEGWAIRP
jgi:Trypsin-co-occurring domain 2